MVQRETHRKAFSFVPASWFSFRSTSAPSQPPVRSKSARVARDYEPKTSVTDSYAPLHTSPELSIADLSSSNHYSFIESAVRSPSSPEAVPGAPPTPPKVYIPADRMNLARKVKKLSRVIVPSDIERVPGQDDPYTYISPSPSILSSSSSPSPSPSKVSFADAQKKMLKRSATLNNSRTALTPHSVKVQRTRSFANPRLAVPPSPSKRNTISPIIFAHPEESSSQSDSEPGSAVYSGSTSPAKASSLAHSDIEELEEPPPLTEASTSGTPSPVLAPTTEGENGDKGDRSPAASIFDPEPDPQELQQRRAAKLVNQLGDDVPPDVLLRATSPPPTPAGPSLVFLPPPHTMPVVQQPTSASASPCPANIPLPPDIPDDALLAPVLPRRSTSLRRIKASRPPAKRRLSLDIRALSPEPAKGARLKKGRSVMVTKKSLDASPPHVRDAEELLREEDRLGEPMSDKQRALNVRRARKMMQLFGDKPPQELFQVPAPSGTDDGVIDALSILTTVSENRRDSRTTFTSSTISLTIHRRIRDSIQSLSEPPSPMVFAGTDITLEASSRSPSPLPEIIDPEAEDEADIETPEEVASTVDPNEGDIDSDSEAELPPLPASPTVHTPGTTLYCPLPQPSIQSLSLASTTSRLSRSQSMRSTAPLNPNGHDSEPELEPAAPIPLPRTPPPFSSLIFAPSFPADVRAGRGAERCSEDTDGRRSTHSPPPGDFRARRLRAAKLSRFFGVAPNDLANVLSAPPPASFNGAPNAAHPPHQHHSSATYSHHQPSHAPPLPNSPPATATELSEPPRKHSVSTVEVATEVPRGFPFGRPEKKPIQDSDMAEVLDQLRRMR
ncbi:hypothetical protein WOLCODRAFT_135187 [Wolfiporia cocos MD-104 SS10]|uniref:Uncharacterized protein n=1 Tax=Wolfiporia cocos (strain MD-104) TaxID=742152 RepID=A0A2H3IVV9_WOLCO|nr:hypothetical protein WOLCODRAFT_135187 [Wolfiporia cocos MD-104 SS10]